MANFQVTLSQAVERGGSADAALRAVRGYVGGQADGHPRGSVTSGRYLYSRDDADLDDMDGDIHAALLSVNYDKKYRVEIAPAS